MIDGNTDVEKTPTIITQWVYTIHGWILNEMQKQAREKYANTERAPLNFII